MEQKPIHTGEIKKEKSVEINDFWDKDVVIKNKRISNEDYNRYKIKDFDIEDWIKKLFG